MAADEFRADSTLHPPPSPSTSHPAPPGLDTAEHSSPHEQPGSPSNDLSNVLDLQALYGRKGAEMGEASWAADLANAMAAVDFTDVLADEAPFASYLVQVCGRQPKHRKDLHCKYLRSPTTVV